MKTPIILMCLILILNGCAPSGHTPTSPSDVLPPTPSLPSPTPSPIGGPSPTPIPTQIPLPTPVFYTCVNHPLAGNTYLNDAGNYTMTFNKDCTYSFTDTSHITYGIWTPDSNPNDVVKGNGILTYSMSLQVTGVYVCLPVNGPQTCQNYGFSGSVVVQVSSVSLGTGLIIIQ